MRVSELARGSMRHDGDSEKVVPVEWEGQSRRATVVWHLKNERMMARQPTEFSFPDVTGQENGPLLCRRRLSHCHTFLLLFRWDKPRVVRAFRAVLLDVENLGRRPQKKRAPVRRP